MATRGDMGKHKSTQLCPHGTTSFVSLSKAQYTLPNLIDSVIFLSYSFDSTFLKGFCIRHLASKRNRSNSIMKKPRVLLFFAIELFQPSRTMNYNFLHVKRNIGTFIVILFSITNNKRIFQR